MIIEIPLAFFVEWIDRKITARVQRRIGPPLLQPVFDFIKLLRKTGKELRFRESFLIPIFLYSSLAILLFLFLFLPFPIAVLSFKGDIILILFLYSLVILFFVIIGYLIPSPYSNIGSARLLQMFTSFEILFILSVSTVIILKGSLTLLEIAEQRIPLVLVLPISFACYLISCAAKLSFTPFDIPNAPTEIAEGWKCEIFGRNLAIVKLCYNLEFLFLSSLGSLFFFGYKNFLVLLFETFVIVVTLSLFKNTAARLRVDQAIEFFWKGAIPLCLLQLLIMVVVAWLG